MTARTLGTGALVALPVIGLFYAFRIDAVAAFYSLNVLALIMGIAMAGLGVYLVLRDSRELQMGILAFLSGLLMSIIHVIKLAAGTIV